jgi:hypothetical protein
MPNQNCVRQYTNDDWTFSFFVGERADGSGLDGAAEIRHAGQAYCRIVSDLRTWDREEMLTLLMRDCTEWVDNWRKQQQMAETTPGDLFFLKWAGLK